jgi:3-deoxy-D-manno-octulosonate 8-phosphate phosphatase (KDO 8-P phosphatase)
MAHPLVDDLDLRARRIRLVLLDVDGVLTDGTVTIHAAGGESKAFFIRDGAAIVWAQRQGLRVGFLSGRPSDATTRRAAELRVSLVAQPGPDKRQAYADILTECGCADDETAYMGDDVLDLPILSRAGLAAAPADAVDEVRGRVHWVSSHPGGRGAVRELLELILRAQGKWDAVVASFSH